MRRLYLFLHWFPQPLIIAAAVMLAWRGLRTGSALPAGFDIAGAVAGMLALLARKTLQRWEPGIAWQRTMLHLAAPYLVGVGAFLGLQQLYLFELRLEPSLLGMGLVLGAAILSAQLAKDVTDAAPTLPWGDGAIVTAGLALGSALQDEMPLPAWAVPLTGLLWVGLARALRLAPVPAPGLREEVPAVALATAGTFLAAAGLALINGSVRGVLSLAPACALLAVLARRLRASLARSRHGGDDLAGILGVAGATAVLGWPLATSQATGSGDAGWYATMLLDALAQFHHGILPVYIGQTEPAFNGSVFPFALAPYLLHFGGLLDLLVLGSIPAIGVLHLALILSLGGGMLAVYAGVRRGVPGIPRGLALALALLFGLSPGVLAPLYTSDMYMTVMTLPWVAAAIWCAVLVARGPSIRRGVALGLSVGVAAWAHSPVSGWAGLACALVLAYRLASGPDRRGLLRAAGIALAVFLLVTAGYLARVAAVMEPVADQQAGIRQLMDSLRSVLPGAFQPVSATATRLSDFQLGYSLWALVSFTLLVAPARAASESRRLLCAFAGLAVLLFPLPHLTERVWRALPEALVIANDAWPMQRLYLVTAATAVAGFAVAYGGAARRPWPGLLIGWVMAAALAWSASEAGRFVAHGRSTVNRSPAGSTSSLAANPRLTNNSFHPYYPAVPLPHYFLDGPVEPALALRWRDPSMPAGPAVPNAPLIPTDTPTVILEAQSHPMWPVFVGLNPRVTLPPDSRWLVQVSLASNRYQGRFHLKGRWIDRQYTLVPTSDPQAPSVLTFSLANPRSETEVLDLLYYPDPGTPYPELPANGTPAGPVSRFATLRLVPYAEVRFPVTINAWLPLRLTSNLPQPVILETFRQGIRGYRARVNGQPVATGVTADHLLTVPLPAGPSTLELAYHPPGIVQAANWLSLATLVGALAFLGRRRGDDRESTRA